MCNCQQPPMMNDTTTPTVEKAKGLLTTGAGIAVIAGIAIGTVLVIKGKGKKKRK